MEKVTILVEKLNVELVQIDQLKNDEKNARKHKRKSLEALCLSLQQFGQRKPIVAKKDGTIVAGNGTFEAARILNWLEINVVFIPENWSEQQITAYALADNATAELSGWDEELLQVNLESIKELSFDLAVLGIPYLKTNLNDLIEIEPSFQTSIKVKPDQIWQLGNHKIMCADSQNINCVRKLMNDELADMVWTDPPYGVDYKEGIIKNDNLNTEDLTLLLKNVFNNLISHTKKGASWYVSAPSSPATLAFANALKDLNIWKHTLIWVKDSMVMGRSDYHYKHEAIYYGWTPGEKHKWYADRKQTTIFEVARPKRSEEHPTMKPLELIAQQMSNSSLKNDLIIDPFVGSGSTILAAEQLNRRCYAMDIAPKYCEVAIDRWERLTGQKAVLLNE